MSSPGVGLDLLRALQNEATGQIKLAFLDGILTGAEHAREAAQNPLVMQMTATDALMMMADLLELVAVAVSE